jgi:hypothetical protein
MSATASLTIPSPKIIEKSLGYSSYFTIDIAAITSDEHNREANKKLSISSNSNTSSPKLLFFINPRFDIRLVRPANTKNVIIVPKIPKVNMYPMFSKKRLLRILKPAAKMIGGRQT